GWNKGRKIHFREVAQDLAARGVVTASIDYRLSGEAPFPAHIHDCKVAVRFLRANAKKYGIAPGRLGAIGHSAGGHLAALLATSAGVQELEGEGGNAEVSSAIQAVVPMGGQTDFLSERNREISRDREIWQQFLGGSQEESPELTDSRLRWFTPTKQIRPAGSSKVKKMSPAPAPTSFGNA
ncbi:MAG: alpha/beta hydrolase, partial [bacterium]|nr:alpha/beta hydrolase [bacterium]